MNEGLNTLSAADVAAVTRNNDGNMWGDGGWFWIIILAFLFCGNGWGNNNGAQDAFISDEFVKRDIFNTNQNVSNTACETQRDVLEKAVSSVSSGNESISYANGNSQSNRYTVAATNVQEEKRILLEAAVSYLFNVTDDNGVYLLYRGI